MKNENDFLSYPVVVKRIYDYVTFSVPDLGIHEKLAIPETLIQRPNLNEKDFFQDPHFKYDYLRALESVYHQVHQHLHYKKWKPEPSTIKTQLKKGEKDYSLPEFQKRLSEFISVSENTIRREIQRGKIIAFITEGGHRRIPESELQRYIESAKTKEA